MQLMKTSVHCTTVVKTKEQKPHTYKPDIYAIRKKKIIIPLNNVIYTSINLQTMEKINGKFFMSIILFILIQLS